MVLLKVISPNLLYWNPRKMPMRSQEKQEEGMRVVGNIRIEQVQKAAPDVTVRGWGRWMWPGVSRSHRYCREHAHVMRENRMERGNVEAQNLHLKEAS